ncbi:hypothetical protein SedNR2807_16200 [Citrobacter sedlakii]|uniref:hypothetical protein n=1 Tax=Citrobacter TaxID=544 RepID=UPI001969F195|nr:MULTISPECIES: hypothetical protein [Citrobacter]MBM9569523.1 hypothetical protein [Citrobacter sedlakii]MEB0952922.1 hypothetical protein [Citrobacter sedlakii]HBL4690718.1 hypothetical protein [Citrobacter sedlakii]HBL4705628.1 hypothetical protein [Citrobacter sedlakii]HBL4719906.1 hypothetical protein [Citrobacter sedlakii]
MCLPYCERDFGYSYLWLRIEGRHSEDCIKLATEYGSTQFPCVAPVYAKSCLKEKGFNDAGSAEEPVESRGEHTTRPFPVPDERDLNDYHLMISVMLFGMNLESFQS